MITSFFCSWKLMFLWPFIESVWKINDFSKFVTFFILLLSIFSSRDRSHHLSGDVKFLKNICVFQLLVGWLWYYSFFILKNTILQHLPIFLDDFLFPYHNITLLGSFFSIPKNRNWRLNQFNVLGELIMVLTAATRISFKVINFWQKNCLLCRSFCSVIKISGKRHVSNASPGDIDLEFSIFPRIIPQEG